MLPCPSGVVDATPELDVVDAAAPVGVVDAPGLGVVPICSAKVL